MHHINFLSRSIAESRGEQLNLHKNLTLFAGLDVTVSSLFSAPVSFKALMQKGPAILRVQYF